MELQDDTEEQKSKFIIEYFYDINLRLDVPFTGGENE